MTVPDLTGALVRLDAAMRDGAEATVTTLLAEVRALTGSEVVLLTTLDDDGTGVIRQRVGWLDREAGTGVAMVVGDDWPWRDSGCAAMLADGSNYEPDFLVAHPGHRIGTEVGLRGYLSVPLRDQRGGHVSGVLCGIDTIGRPVPDEVVAAVRVLAAAATNVLVAEVGRRSAAEVDRLGEVIDELAQRARATREELADSLTVASGWVEALRDAQEPPATGQLDPLGIVAEQLDHTSAAVGALIEEVAEATAAGAARDRVDVVPLLAELLGRDPEDVVDADPTDGVWVACDAVRLRELLTGLAAAVLLPVHVLEDRVVVPLDPALVLGEDDLALLAAAGGRPRAEDGLVGACFEHLPSVVVPPDVG